MRAVASPARVFKCVCYVIARTPPIIAKAKTKSTNATHQDGA